MIAEALRKREIPFCAVTSEFSGRCIYIIEYYPFLETELVGLLEKNQLHLDGIRKLRQQIEHENSIRI